RLRGAMQAVAVMALAPRPASARPALADERTRRTVAAIGIAAVATIAVAVYLNGIGETPAAAAVIELNRLIATSAAAADRTYRIAVEEVAPEMPHAKRPEAGRPPKPSMEGAVLHVQH